MKKDIEILLTYLRAFQDSFDIQEVFLYGEKEDQKRVEIIRQIAKKYKIDYSKLDIEGLV